MRGRWRRAWVALIGMAVLACGRGRESSARPSPTVTLGAEDVARVQLATVQNGPTVSGRLVAQRLANVRSQTNGSVTQVFVQEGQPVQQGQLLVQIDPAAAPKQFAAARSAVESATNGLREAELEEQRTRTLATAGALARQDLDRAEANTASHRAQLDAAKAELANARHQLSHARVFAPFTGVVSERNVSPGDIVQPGTPLFQVVDPHVLRLEVSVPVQALSQLRVGTPVEFTVTGFGDRHFEGRIAQVNPVIDAATGQVRIYAEVPNPDGELMSGLYAEGRVALQRARGPSVPIGAIVRNPGTPPTLSTLQNGVVAHVPVRVTLEDPLARRALVEGVAAGTPIIVGGARDLPDGTPVKVTAPVQRPSPRSAAPRGSAMATGESGARAEGRGTGGSGRGVPATHAVAPSPEP